MRNRIIGLEFARFITYLVLAIPAFAHLKQNALPAGFIVTACLVLAAVFVHNIPENCYIYFRGLFYWEDFRGWKLLFKRPSDYFWFLYQFIFGLLQVLIWQGFVFNGLIGFGLDWRISAVVVGMMFMASIFIYERLVGFAQFWLINAIYVYGGIVFSVLYYYTETIWAPYAAMMILSVLAHKSQRRIREVVIVKIKKEANPPVLFCRKYSGFAELEPGLRLECALAYVEAMRKHYPLRVTIRSHQEFLTRDVKSQFE